MFMISPTTRRQAQAGLAAIITSMSLAAHAAIDISNTPLFLTLAVPANVIITLDDSGSMCRGYVPDSMNGRGPSTSPATVTGFGNGLYYDPTQIYPVPTTSATGHTYTTSFNAARPNGFVSNTTTVNLATQYAYTSNYCNAVSSTTTYTCTAAFGMESQTCGAVFSPGTSGLKTCNDTTFTRNSYSSTCNITYQHSTNPDRNFITAANCADTSMSPFSGLNPGGRVTIGGQQYRLTNTQNSPANGATTIQVRDNVTSGTQSNRSVSWDQGNDTIRCNDQNADNFFSGLIAGSNVSVSGNNSNNGTFSLARNPTDNNRTIEVNETLVSQNGARASFSWIAGSGNTITVSDCGRDPFAGLQAGDSITITGSTSNNGTFTLTAAPGGSRGRTLTVSQTVVAEASPNITFLWSGNTDTVSVSNCVDSQGDPNNAPFASLGEGDEVNIGNAGANSGEWHLASDPSNGDTTLQMTNNFSTSGTMSGVTFSWSSGSSITLGNEAAYYHIFYSDLGQTQPSNCTAGDRSDTDCYVKITVGSTTDLAYADIWPDATSSQQNFANWYSFYRTRALSVMSGATTAVTSFDNDEVRLAWQTINKCTSFSASSSGCLNIDNRIRALDDSQRSNFHGWLERFVPSGFTPLRNAMQRAGNYYMTSEPYVTSATDSTELTCRKNFHVLFTDGYWNGTTPSNPTVGNADNTTTTLPDNKTYTPIAPYKDDNTSSLADVSFYYWATDLRDTLANEVRPYTADQSTANAYTNPKNDPATWQHMVNFTIGLGLSADLGSNWGGNTYLGAYDDFLDGTLSWPSSSLNSGKVYDLWHAALNSRGQFFSADSADAISTAFTDIVNAIKKGNPSAAAVAANSSSIQTNTLIYQASFDGSDWSGHLKAIEVLSDGSIGAKKWDAATLLPAHGDRNIFTINSGTGIGASFNATSCLTLSASQKTYLANCSADLINYLRGDTSKEIRFSTASVPTTYRNRVETVLGDIINSDPAYTFREDLGYASAAGLSTAEKSTYAAFVANKINSGRLPMIYVGSNDGMLHAFNADGATATGGGQEIFAFVPSGVYPGLQNLTSTSFTHQYLVDGAPAVGDVYVADAWKTYLVGSLGAGGQSVFALDVSNPAGFTASDVKWEYSDSTDLGLTFSKPQITRLRNGNWVAIFGNGYNSASGHAVLYVVNLATGTLIQKLDTYSLDSNTVLDNGLSTPVTYSATNNGVTDYVYAGDLHGNLWKFDLTSTNSSDWSLATEKLFTATDSVGTAQPIYYQPAVSAYSGGMLVHFGTGLYLTTGDVNDMSVQSFYAIWDDNDANTSTAITRDDLKQQYITEENYSATIGQAPNTTPITFAVRESTEGTVAYPTQKGWFMDLLVFTYDGTAYTPGTAQGERLHSVPLLKDGRVIFVTLIPSTDSCDPGGDSWLMEVDAIHGSRTTTSAFDFNNDDTFTADDLLTSGHTASGVKLDLVGIATTPTWLNKSDTVSFKVMTGSTGETMSLKNKGGDDDEPGTGTYRRIHWKQIL